MVDAIRGDDKPHDGVNVEKAIAWLNAKEADKLRLGFIKGHRALEQGAKSSRELVTKPAVFVPFRGGIRG